MTEVHAQVGDRIVIASDQGAGRDRTGEVVAVHRADGAPPYLIRWDHDGSEMLVFPGPTAFFLRDSAGDGRPEAD